MKRKRVDGSQRLLFAALWAAAVCLMPASPCTANPVTLEECIAMALRHNPELEQLGHEIRAADQDIVKKRSTTLPNVSSRLDTYEVNGSPVTPFSPFNVSQPGFANSYVHWGPLAMQSVDVTYPIFQYGSIMGLNDAPVVNQARAELTKQEIARSIVEQKIILEVTNAFLTANWYHEDLGILREMTEVSRQRLEGIKSQVSEGEKNQQSAIADQVAADGLAGQLRATEEGLAVALERVSSLTGVDIGAHSTPAGPFGDLGPLPPLRSLLDEVLSSHPALRLQQAQVEVARQQLRAVSADQWPVVTLNSSFQGAESMGNGGNNGTGRSPTAFLSYLEVKVPLFDFGGKRAAKAETQEQYLAEKSHLKGVELDLRRSILQSYSDISAIDEQIAQMKTTYQLAVENQVEINAHRGEGLDDTLAALKAEQERLTALLPLRIQQVSKELKYAELQNLSGGIFRWLDSRKPPAR